MSNSNATKKYILEQQARFDIGMQELKELQTKGDRKLNLLRETLTAVETLQRENEQRRAAKTKTRRRTKRSGKK